VKLHIFDVDFTIVTCSTVRAFIFRGLRTGLIGPSLGFYAPALFLRYGARGSRPAGGGRSYSFLRGVRREDLEDLARQVFEERLLPRIDPIVAARIAAARAGGGRAIIASSSFTAILEPLADYLGIGEVIANELEFQGGRTTGRMLGLPAFGEGKRYRVLAYLESAALRAADCSFYSDSSRDLPLLEEAGHPVAVNPGPRLRRAARASGWEILDPRPRRKDARHA
jgi:putative phosphoserine phosphatase / 1-acylglycerol-3-phosphate O-acyltransferase